MFIKIRTKEELTTIIASKVVSYKKSIRGKNDIFYFYTDDGICREIINPIINNKYLSVDDVELFFIHGDISIEIKEGKDRHCQ